MYILSIYVYHFSQGCLSFLVYILHKICCLSFSKQKVINNHRDWWHHERYKNRDSFHMSIWLCSLARIKDDNFGEWCWINQVVTLQQLFHLWSPFRDLTNILFFLCQNTEDTQRISFSLPESISSWALAISYDIILICSIDDIMLTGQENLLVCCCVTVHVLLKIQGSDTSVNFLESRNPGHERYISSQTSCWTLQHLIGLFKFWKKFIPHIGVLPNLLTGWPKKLPALSHAQSKRRLSNRPRLQCKQPNHLALVSKGIACYLKGL